jgi:hypothetical protein
VDADQSMKPSRFDEGKVNLGLKRGDRVPNGGTGSQAS